MGATLSDNDTLDRFAAARAWRPISTIHLGRVHAVLYDAVTKVGAEERHRLGQCLSYRLVKRECF